MPSLQIRGVPVAPLTGPLDLRSEVALMEGSSLRMRQNFQATGKGKLTRGCGWAKLLDSATYNNQDFHDQLLYFGPNGAIRQPVTMLFPAESTMGVRSLILATQSQICMLVESSGDYRVLGNAYGGVPSASASAPRFKAAQVNDYVAFTNDFNKPMYYVLEDGSGTLLQTFDDLDTIGVSRAAVTWAWRGCLFFADVVMDGQRQSNLLLWSDYQNPTSFDPAVLSSITGTKYLNPGERILAGLEFGNSFLIYTTENIWEMVVVGGDQSFDFAIRYPGSKNRSIGLLKYPNTLASLGDEHCYLAEDGLYTFNPYYLKPDRVEWAHLATPEVLDNIDSANCSVHVGLYNNYEYLLSVAKVGDANNCPSVTLRLNTAYSCADVVDAGFTAFCNFQSFLSPTVRDFITSNGICSLQGMANLGFPLGQQGVAKPPGAITSAFTPDCFYTKVTQTIGDVTVEDWNQAHAAPTSLCALLGNQTFDSVCRKCAGPTLLVAASSDDWCLKQIGGVSYREVCLNPSAIGSFITNAGYSSAVGNYALRGYDSILRLSPMYIAGERAPMMQLDSVTLDFEARASSQPASVSLRVGVSAQPTDPNGPDMQWFAHSAKTLALQSSTTPAQRLAANVTPSQVMRWQLYRVARMLYLELTISGTGGDADFSRVTVEAGPSRARNF